MPKIKTADWKHVSEYSLATEVRVKIFCTLSWGMRVWSITMKQKWKASHLYHEHHTSNRFTFDEDVQTAMAKWFREQPKKFYTDTFKKTCLSLVSLYQLRGGLQGKYEVEKQITQSELYFMLLIHFYTLSGCKDRNMEAILLKRLLYTKHCNPGAWQSCKLHKCMYRLKGTLTELHKAVPEESRIYVTKTVQLQWHTNFPQKTQKKTALHASDYF